MLIFVLIYVFIGLFFYTFGLYSMKKYNQEKQSTGKIVYNYFIVMFLWPVYVCMAIDVLAKTGVYKKK